MYRGNDYAKISSNALFGAALVIAGLYFAREVLIPLSVAILLSFLLAMPCAWLESHHIPRALAVVKRGEPALVDVITQPR